MKKELFDVVFILGIAAVMVLLLEYIPANKFIGFSFLPVLFAYYMGQYSQRKFSRKQRQREEKN